MLNDEQTGRQGHSIYEGFVLLLIGIMLLCALSVTLLGAKIYASSVQKADSAYALRTSLAYISQRVRRADSAQAVTVEGQECLTLGASEGGQVIETLIYARDGMLREKTVAAGTERTLTGGQALLTLEGLSLTEKDGLLFIRAQSGGRSSELIIRGKTA